MLSLNVQNKKIESFLYFIFIVSYLFDPTGIFINLKMPALFLVFFWWIVTCKKINIRNLCLVILIYIILTISTFNMLVNNYIYNETLFLSYFKTFITLFILSVNIPYSYLEKPFFFISIIISLITIFLSIVSAFFPMLMFVFQIPPFNTIFLCQKRPILGMTFNMIFHISSPIIVILLAQKTADFLKNHSFSKLITIALYALTLFFSGTRANMLSGILVIGLVYLYYCYAIKHQINKVAILTILFILFSFIVVILLLSDTSSGSSDIKEKHITSTIRLFLDNNISMLLFGNGPASMFYSAGFGGFTNRTELSYLDLFRLFGICGALPIIFIYFFPLYGAIKNRSFENISFAIGYLAYLFIAGTNPLLIVPQGFIAIILAYNFLLQKNDFSFSTCGKQKSRLLLLLLR